MTTTRRPKGASKDPENWGLEDIYPTGDEVEVISHDAFPDAGAKRRQAAVDAAEAGTEPLTPEQMKAQIVDMLLAEGVTPEQLWVNGLVDRQSYLEFRSQDVHDEVRFRVNARAEQPRSRLAQRCAWFERTTRTDPLAGAVDVRSARYQRGNAQAHAIMRAHDALEPIPLDARQLASIVPASPRGPRSGVRR